MPSSPPASESGATSLRPGLTAAVSLDVGPEDTAAVLRSGDVEVLGTPRMLALCEEASMLAVRDHIPESMTTVAVRVQINHLAPVRVGGSITAEATLERIEGRRLTFTITARADESHADLVGAGRLVRVLIDRETFMAKANDAAR